MDSLDALFALERFGIRPGLDTIRLLVRAMGDPQSSYRTVIVAGTNGKGSVVAMADSALRAAGHRVGRYTSPHLNVLAERFVVDGAVIPERDLRREAAQVHEQVDRLLADGRLHLTALAVGQGDALVIRSPSGRTSFSDRGRGRSTC